MIKFHTINKIYLDKSLLKTIKRAEKWFIKQKYVLEEFVEYDDRCLFLTEDNKIVALTVYRFYRTYTYLPLIYVNKIYRGKGLLKEMINQIEGETFKWGTCVHNLDAVVAYAKLGAKLKKRIKQTDMIDCVFQKNK